MKQADLRDMFKKALTSVCTSTVVASPHPLSPKPAASSAVETMTLNQQMKDISKLHTPLISCAAQV